MEYTQDQILQLAPDSASAKAGQQLANAAKWLEKGSSPHALWGDCQGSGKTPYKTMIDLENIAFKCSCPSRKFPCKHGLGLMLLYSRQPGIFGQGDPPPAVAEWLEKRAVRETAKEQKASKPADEAARQKRVDSREKKINAGIAELQLWLQDVIRTGIMNAPQQAYQLTQHITARMVDAQAPGLAAQLRQVEKINFYKEGWQKQLLLRLATLHMIGDAYSRADTLPEDMVRELQTLVGWTQAKEEVLQQEPLRDHWIVLSVTQAEEASILTERIWLYGRERRQFALLLHFYGGNQRPGHMMIPGAALNAGLVYFAGRQQHRALLCDPPEQAPALLRLPAPASLTSVYSEVARLLSVNPFAPQVPFLLQDIRLQPMGDQWQLLDAGGQAAAVSNTAAECWRILAFSLGEPFSCFGLYEEEQLQLHFVWRDDTHYFVK